MTHEEIARKALDLCKRIFNHYNKDSLDLAKELLHLEEELNASGPPKGETLTFTKSEGKEENETPEEDFPDLP